jgi:hypothetical protein
MLLVITFDLYIRLKNVKLVCLSLYVDQCHYYFRLHLYLISDNKNDANVNIASIGSSLDVINVEDTDLLNREVIIGIIVWLILLSLIILTILLCLCVRRLRESRDSNGYVQHVDARSRRPPEVVSYHKDGAYY